MAGWLLLSYPCGAAASSPRLASYLSLHAAPLPPPFPPGRGVGRVRPHAGADTCLGGARGHQDGHDGAALARSLPGLHRGDRWAWGSGAEETAGDCCHSTAEDGSVGGTHSGDDGTQAAPRDLLPCMPTCPAEESARSHATGFVDAAHKLVGMIDKLYEGVEMPRQGGCKGDARDVGQRAGGRSMPGQQDAGMGSRDDLAVACRQFRQHPAVFSAVSSALFRLRCRNLQVRLQCGQPVEVTWEGRRGAAQLHAACCTTAHPHAPPTIPAPQTAALLFSALCPAHVTPVAGPPAGHCQPTHPDAPHRRRGTGPF